MRRIHFIEIEDQEWCPKAIRDGLTDLLRFAIRRQRQYDSVVPLLSDVLDRLGTDRIVDLCSGAGGPWPELLLQLSAHRLQVVLTDQYPNLAALKEIKKRLKDRIELSERPVDAMKVPHELSGFRTLFTSFHHFGREQAQSILQDAVAAGQGIGIFEYTERSARGLAWICLSPLAMFLFTPFLLPFRWSRLFFTYLVPVMPLVALFDGIVSCLRSYSEVELAELCSGFGDAGYTWKIGKSSGGYSPLPVTYLIGYPDPGIGTR